MLSFKTLRKMLSAYLNNFYSSFPEKEDKTKSHQFYQIQTETGQLKIGCHVSKVTQGYKI